MVDRMGFEPTTFAGITSLRSVSASSKPN